jgi:DEAD/DEAH box helicase domain-containing protein
LDLEKKLCRVEPVEVDYYTEAVWEGRVTLTESLDRIEWGDGQLEFGFINVNRQPKLYKKIRERTLENIGYGPITLDPFIYDTTGFCLQVPQAWQAAVSEVDKRYVGAALYGLSYILRQTAPSLCLGDRQDIETDVSLKEISLDHWESALYLFDTIEGGVGYAEKIFEAFEEALKLCRAVIQECECIAGCPSCVPAIPPGVNSEELEQLLLESNASVACTISLIESLLTKSVVMPEVAQYELAPRLRIDPPEADLELERLQVRMGKASEILKQKRARTH